jgi:lipopolysaccharide biosynthesis protein
VAPRGNQVASRAAPSPAPLEGLAEQCADFAFGVVTRGNEGFDFQSWRRGIEELRSRSVTVDRLILTNGSMHGPVADLDHILVQMDRHATWGMTESMDLHRHIQSWWLAFGRPALDHPQFDRYWSRVRPASNKWGTILTHELKWAEDLSLAGPAAAYVRFEDHRCPRNPLFFAWRELIRDWQMPFFKRSLLLANYDRIDMTGWEQFLAEAAPGFDLSLVEPAGVH